MQNVIQQQIKDKLKDSSLTVSDFERKAGLSANAVRYIISGRHQNPRIDTMSAIADTLGCSLDELVGHRIRQETKTPSILEVCEQLDWNGDLFVAIAQATRDFIEKSQFTPALHKLLEAMIEIYNYCLIKQKGQFDVVFHEWYMNKFLENTHAR